MKLLKRSPNGLSYTKIWLAIVLVGAGLVVFGYVAVQQSFRLAVNDPQQQLAEDAAAKLAGGAKPADVVSSNVVDEASSLAPFVTVVDRNLHVLATSGKISGQTPLPPRGAFTSAKDSSHNWVTWQHNGGVRDAAVIVAYGGSHPGYVLAARSLRNVENNTAEIAELAAATLVGVVLVPAIIFLVL